MSELSKKEKDYAQNSSSGAIANIQNVLNKSCFAADATYQQEIEAYMRYLSSFINDNEELIFK